LHLRSLANAPDHDAAIIRVENIDGAILLLSGTDDHVWPSTAMADRVMKRLDAHHFRFAHEHLRYEGAGHTCCAGQLFRAGADSSSIVWFGGTPDVNAKARADSWTKILEFLKANLQQ